MSVVQDAINFYHKSLEKHATDPVRTLADIHEQHRKHKIVYTNRAMPTMLRPYFITPDQVKVLEHSVAVLMRCLERVVDLWCEHEEVRRAIPFGPLEEEMFRIPSGLKRNVAISRLDSFMSGTVLQYIEFNCDSPASMMWNNESQAVFNELPMMEDLRREFIIEEADPARACFEALVSAYKEFGLNEEPRLIITDWNGVSTYLEFELVRDYFIANGIPATIADPRELEFRDGHIWAGDFKGNMVNRRVIWRELADKLDECQGLIDAARSGKVCIVNPFKAKIVGNKACLSFMADPRNHRFFSREEQEVIRNHVPWSTNLQHEPMEYRGEVLDPFETAVKYREAMVLKPLNDYGGRGVLIGNETNETDWENALAVAEEGDWGIQELVKIPEEVFPITEPEFHYAPRKINLNPFGLGGRYAGCLTRVSASSVINVTAGGGMLPTFVVAGKR